MDRVSSVGSSPAGRGSTFAASGRPLKDIIVLAPCGADEVLPTNADLPADLFTSCLLTPMPIALRWFVKRNTVSSVVILAACSGNAALVAGVGGVFFARWRWGGGGGKRQFWYRSDARFNFYVTILENAILVVSEGLFSQPC